VLVGGEVGAISVTFALWVGLAILVIVAVYLVWQYFQNHPYAAFGDPPFVTLDGRAFDLQSVGEFHLLKARPVDIQSRFVAPGDRVSVWNRLAVRDGDSQIEFGADGSWKGAVGASGHNLGVLGGGTIYGKQGASLVLSPAMAS
jgi:hypothetical protein